MDRKLGAGQLNAVDFFSQASRLGLTAFINSESVFAPKPDDIIVFGSTKNNQYGHVAIVTEVSGNSVTCIEENWSRTGIATLQMGQQNNQYTIQPRGSYKILGWLRRPSSEVVIQPGPDTGKDIWTTSVYSHAPGGGGPGGGLNDDKLRVGGWGDLYYSLLQFDLNGLPANAKSAVLYMHCFNQSGGGTPMYLDLITQFWDWRTQGTGSDRLRLWWADRPSTTQWIAGQIPNPTQGQWYSVDITSLYNAWQDGTLPNYGLQFRPVDYFNNNFNEFYSSDYIADPSLRPMLVIEQ